ncbi:beta-glucosidase [Lachnospiraceae bacterium C7]|nr:beta-glucosidase [Lachnospiraceae bacterium C7]
MDKKHALRCTMASVVAVAMVVCVIIANVYTTKYASLISVFLGADTQKIVNNEGKDKDKFASDFKDKNQMKKHLQKVGADIESEGAVLLENNGGLPLSKKSSITLLGQDSVDLVYGGGGSGSVDVKKAVSLYKALDKKGFKTNDTVKKFYESGAGSKYRKTVVDQYGKGEFSVNEVPQSEYTDDVKDSFKDYDDAAIVVIGRSGGESADLTRDTLSTGAKYLQLDKNELDLIKMAKDNFKKVVVLLNTQNPVELGELKDLNVDAVAWVGALGETGANGLVDLLDGTKSFSGRLVDTYAYDSQSAPAMENFGSYKLTNSKAMFGNNYMVYGEGIYVGYKYYETRYEDVVMGKESKDNYDYSQTVQYPFGYGLSYTDFKYTSYEVDEKRKNIKVNVEVENTGKVAGKEVVQIYMQSPYTDYDKENQIEKSSVELVGYTKTKTLKPGEKQKVEIKIPKSVMKTYDAYKTGSYVLDAGDYYFATGKNAHDALNNILAQKGYSSANGMDQEGDSNLAHKIEISHMNTEEYSKSEKTGQKITNQFTDGDIKKYDNNYKYLSRSDWEGTWPKTYNDGKWDAPSKLVKGEAIKTVKDTVKKKPVLNKVDSKKGKLTVAMMQDVDYDDPLWDTLIDQMSLEEIDKLVRVGGYSTVGADSIQLPATTDKDGTAGISSTLVGGENGTAFPPEIVIASTFNDELAKEFGKCIGEDSIDLKVSGWYAPAMNIHRTPYSGRNFEYYSEDGYLSGKMGEKTVEGAQSKGAMVTIKHFALNDQETNRMGVNIFANEQSIRELYLKAFEPAVEQANAHGVMASMNRIGNTWSGGHKGLMTNVLRKEWEFKGFVVTDQASYASFAYEDLREGMAAGTNLWLNSDAELWKLEDSDMNNTIITNMKNSAKNIVYAISRSNSMNGLSEKAKIVQITPWWQYALYAGYVVILLLAFMPLAVMIFSYKKVEKIKLTIAAYAVEIIYSIIIAISGVVMMIATQNDDDLSAEFVPLGQKFTVSGIVLALAVIVAIYFAKKWSKEK